MSSQAHRRNGPRRVPHPGEIESLYLDFVKAFYDDHDRRQARRIAARLERLLAASPECAGSIRGEEIRSLIAELRGDFAEAARSREAEIRKILQLHALTLNTPKWKYVSRQYDFSDVSDRLDLLATLYDAQGDLDRAVATLLESRSYCQSHRIPFDGQDLLDELAHARSAAADRIRVRPVSRKSVKRARKRKETI